MGFSVLQSERIASGAPMFEIGFWELTRRRHRAADSRCKELRGYS